MSEEFPLEVLTNQFEIFLQRYESVQNAVAKSFLLFSLWQKEKLELLDN